MPNNQLNKWMTICYQPLPSLDFKTTNLPGLHHVYIMPLSLTNHQACSLPPWLSFTNSRWALFLPSCHKSLQPLTSLADPLFPFKSFLNSHFIQWQKLLLQSCTKGSSAVSPQEKSQWLWHNGCPLPVWPRSRCGCSQHPCQGRGFLLSSVQYISYQGSPLGCFLVNGLLVGITETNSTCLMHRGE